MIRLSRIGSLYYFCLGFVVKLKFQKVIVQVIGFDKVQFSFCVFKLGLLVVPE